MVEAQGHSGGLVLFWSGGSIVKILCSISSFIDMEVRIAEFPVFRLTGFYSEPSRQYRYRSWDNLRLLAGPSELPWCVFGDIMIKSVLDQNEKNVVFLTRRGSCRFS